MFRAHTAQVSRQVVTYTRLMQIWFARSNPGRELQVFSKRTARNFT